MSKIKELKAAFEASTPGEWEAQDNANAVAYAGWELANISEVPQSVFAVAMPEHEAKFIALAHNLMPQLLAAAEMVRRARSLIAEAVDVHIYNVENGEVPDPDCRYMAFLNDSKTLLKELK